MKRFFFCLFLVLCTSFCYSQNEIADSTKQLDEVIVRSFEQNKSLRSVAAPVSVLNLKKAEFSPKSSLVNVMNTVPGVRMEERSPGSYRLNIRGSSLRSPFGVRNVKVYWNDILMTDPGGNTYFNQLAWNNIATIEISKGPAGSMYGAGTGGLIILNPISQANEGIETEISRGSYNQTNVFATARFGHHANRNIVSYAHNSSDGYREQSKMSRENFSWSSQLKLTDKQRFSISILYTDLYYQTPGALTLSEFNKNPRSARPAAGGFPSSIDARAAIKQTNFLAGFSHTYKISSILTNKTSFFGSFTDLNNPAVRNYERRFEPGFGGRSVFVFNNDNEDSNWQIVTGVEFQHGFFNTIVFKNSGGKPDSVQTNDDITYSSNSYFIQGDIKFNNNWLITAGASVNRSKVNFSRLNQFPVINRSRYYKDEVAPRVFLKKIFKPNFFVSAGISRGFSPPTIAELLPSTSVIGIGLEAEYGWNYETNINYLLFGEKLKMQLTGFYFKLNKALVQRRDSSGADYFVNAGNIKEKGLEFEISYSDVASKGIVKSYGFNSGVSLNHFRYGSFIRNSISYSGKTVPSVPNSSFSFTANFEFRNNFYSNLNYYAAGKIFLNDDNTASADPYHLLAMQIGWKHVWKKKFQLKLFAGAENIFDEIYSLGNDINATAGRFYNTAAPRTYYAGIGLQWLNKSVR